MGNTVEEEEEKNACISDMAQITLQGLLKTILRNCRNGWGPFNGGKRVVGATLQKRWKARSSSESDAESWGKLRRLWYEGMSLVEVMRMSEGPALSSKIRSRLPYRSIPEKVQMIVLDILGIRICKLKII
ncbi:hypothetical protein HJG60_011126 [Phyllostomus discolor]|uniref:Uncharacterized protein n=1 Tax=Phyllostomus discolor TaxID=89673 RepID=A0A834E7G7_9CHIR|nr:hypothetical protein HJG60_011126 [Phyllostomus discolor]